jgi:hypothetical protein
VRDTVSGVDNASELSSASSLHQREQPENPEEITAHAEHALCRDFGQKACDFGEVATFATKPSVEGGKATRRKPRKLSDDAALAASKAIEGGNSVRAEARALGVSHVALLKRIKQLQAADGYLPDELDKALIREVLDAGIQGGLGRLSDWTGWTRVELLEVVR